MKKGVKIASWSVFTLLVVVLLVFVDSTYSAIPCVATEVNIAQESGHRFITENTVKEQIKDLGYIIGQNTIGEVETDYIENKIKQTPGVKNVEVYEQLDGTLVLDIKQSKPIARIITQNGLVSFYLDEDGETIPLSKNYIARVPVFSGYIPYITPDLLNVNTIKNNDSLKNKHVIDNIFDVAKAIDNNEFIKAQTLQVYVNEKQEFEMIPRVGRNLIILGTSKNIEDKLHKLDYFYKEVIQPQELNNYDTINLKYNNQIVCSKR